MHLLHTATPSTATIKLTLPWQSDFALVKLSSASACVTIEGAVQESESSMAQGVLGAG